MILLELLSRLMSTGVTPFLEKLTSTSAPDGVEVTRSLPCGTAGCEGGSSSGSAATGALAGFSALGSGFGFLGVTGVRAASCLGSGLAGSGLGFSATTGGVVLGAAGSWAVGAVGVTGVAGTAGVAGAT